MRTIRRLYFYAVALISLEVVVWGLINLLRTILDQGIIGGSATRLAGALALTLVGVPVFGLHWWVVQRDSRREMDEHASGVRAFFMYAVLLSTLIPIVQNILTLLNHLLLSAFNLPATQAMFGQSQNWIDNLIAMLVNALVSVYFIRVLRLDWQGVTPRTAFSDFRRVYRYVWVIYSLVMTAAAVQQLLLFALDVPAGTIEFILRSTFVNGLTLAVVGTPVWYVAWKTVQDSLSPAAPSGKSDTLGGVGSEVAERESLLRLGLLYALSLAGVITVLTSSGIVLTLLLREILGEGLTLQVFIQKISAPVSIGIPLAGVWAYYGNWLSRSLKEIPDAPRRSGLRRLYAYILSALGLGAAFTGVSMLLSFIVDALTGSQVWGNTLRLNLSAALATLGVGLPLWLLSWRPMQAEAFSGGDSGDHARRSLVRRIYLYLALFIAVIGGMISTGSLVYLLLNALLGGSATNILQGSLKALELAALFALLGVYHGRTMGRDGKTAGRTLIEKHASFTTLIIDEENGTFGAPMLAAVQKQTPNLPASLQSVVQPVAGGSDVKAVVLPAGLALDPPEWLRRWLETFNGQRLVVPRPAEGWVWVGSAQTDLNQAALALRQLAEGQQVRQRPAITGWTVFLYVIAGLFGLEALAFLISLGASLIFR
jgi:hypothetical protein